MPRNNKCYTCGKPEQYDNLMCERCWVLQDFHTQRRWFIIPVLAQVELGWRKPEEV